MKLKIQKSLLQDSINLVKLGIASNPILPILEEIKVTLSVGNMRLQSTDNNIAITLDVPCDSSSECSFTFTKKAIDLIPSLKNEELTLNLKDSTLKISQGKNSYKFPIGDYKDFPTIKTVEDFEDSITLEYANFKQSIVDSLPFCSNNEMQPAMTGVFVELKGDSVLLTATNAHLLSHIIIESPTLNETEERSVIIPNSFAKIFKTLKLNPDFCKVSFLERMICISMDGISISCRLIDENYPNFRAIMPDSEVGGIDIDKKRFGSALKRLSLLANSTSKQAALVYQNDGFALAVNDLDFQINAVEIFKDDLDINLDDGHIGVNISFLQSIIPTLHKNRVQLSLATYDKKSPILIKEFSDSVKKIALVMPVMLGGDNFDSIREKIK
jgi:DNA polymerase-3 subunit beta